MKYWNKLLPVLLSLLLIFALASSSCGAKYQNDVTLGALFTAALEKAPVEGGYLTSEDDYIAMNFPADARATLTENMADFRRDYSAVESDMNELLIVRTAEGKSVKAVREAVQKYFDKQVKFLEDNARLYSQTELGKIKAAKVTVYGNYVVMTVFDSAATGAVLSAIESALKI